MVLKGTSHVPSLRLAATFLLLATAGAGLLIAGLQIAGPQLSLGPAAMHGATADGMAESGARIAVASEATDASETAADEPSRTSSQYAFTWPAAGSISQGLSPAHPTGIDVRAVIGDPIEAVRAGEVWFAGGDPCCMYGYYVIVDHGEGWTSLYGHLSEISVEAGDHVLQGDLLGLAGNTGKSDGAHLHLELWWQGGAVNPLGYLEPTRYYTPVYVAVEASEDGRPEALPPQEHAIDRAVRWMEGPAGDYSVERGSCFALAAGPNWSVSCPATLLGCGADVCEATLEACVVGPLSLVEATCSGYALSGR